MINIGYVFHPSSCGYYCLRYIIKRCKIKRIGYMSLYDLKEVLLRYNYYCFCCRVKELNNIKSECISMINIKNSYHYVVVKCVNDKYVWFYDPLFLFIRKVKKEKFIRKWSKICLFFRKI